MVYYFFCTLFAVYTDGVQRSIWDGPHAAILDGPKESWRYVSPNEKSQHFSPFITIVPILSRIFAIFHNSKTFSANFFQQFPTISPAFFSPKAVTPQVLQSYALPSLRLLSVPRNRLRVLKVPSQPRCKTLRVWLIVDISTWDLYMYIIK